jgi:hypothetical protein
MDRQTSVELEREGHAQAIAQLEKNHGDMVLACRKVSDRLAEVLAQHENAQREYINAEHDGREAEFAIAEHYRQKPQPDSFPLPNELADWESQLATLKAEHTKVVTVVAIKWAGVEALRAERGQLHPRLQYLKGQELDLREQLGLLRRRVLPAA